MSILLVTVSVAFTGASAQHLQRPQSGGQKQRQEDQQNRPRNNGPFGGANIQAGPGMGANNSRGGDWLRKHLAQPPQEQQRALEDDPTFRALPPQQQDRLRDRLQKFNSLPPDRRERIVQRMQAWDRMSPDQKDRARDLFQRFRGLPDDRRKAMVFAFRNLRSMSPEQRQRAMDSPQFRGSFSDDERNILKGMTDLNIGPGHQNETGNPVEDGGPQD